MRSPFQDSEIVAAVWAALRPGRDRAHRARGRSGCPRGGSTALRMLGGAAPADCEDCYDLLVDVLVHLAGSNRLAGAANPAAYARRAAEHVLSDRLRAGNTALHGVARPDRADGTIGTIRAALAAGASGLAPAWADELLTGLLTAASERAPLTLEVWPHDRFAEAKAARTGRPARPAEVAADVAAVLATIDATAGRAWRDANVDAPLRARAALYTDLRIGQPCPVTGEPVDPAAPAADPDVGETALRAAFWSALRTHDPVHAARIAVAEVGGRPPGPAGLRRLATGWLADLLAVAGPADRATPTGVRRAVAALLGAPAARRVPADVVEALVTHPPRAA